MDKKNQKMAEKQNDEWKNKLTEKQYKILRDGETEAPFTGKYVHTKTKGIYRCAACGAELFSSETKFDSGTGWPSFTEPANRKHITLHRDTSYGMERVEVRCAKCDSHLGHVFNDMPRIANKVGGSKSSGARYCINSECLLLDEENK